MLRFPGESIHSVERAQDENRYPLRVERKVSLVLFHGHYRIYILARFELMPK